MGNEKASRYLSPLVNRVNPSDAGRGGRCDKFSVVYGPISRLFTRRSARLRASERTLHNGAARFASPRNS